MTKLEIAVTVVACAAIITHRHNAVKVAVAYTAFMYRENLANMIIQK